MYIHTYIHIDVHICDWLWKNPPVTHEDKHLKICNSSIQSVIYQEDLELQPCNLLNSCKDIPTPQCTAIADFPTIQLVYINTSSTYVGVVGSHEVAGYIAKLNNFQGKMAYVRM